MCRKCRSVGRISKDVHKLAPVLAVIRDVNPSFAENSLLSGDARKSGFLESWRVRAMLKQSMIYMYM